MSTEIFPVPDRVREGASSPITDRAQFLELSAAATADPSGFWLAEAQKRLRWAKAPTLGLEGTFATLHEGPLRWFADGILNVTHTCVDQWAESQPDKVAILWEGDEPEQVRYVTYRELQRSVCRAANALVSLGVQPGDRVILYMGMVPETAIAMLACARIGAVHSVVFGGFSADSLRDRIIDCGAKVVITQDQGKRGGKLIPLKEVADHAMEGLHVRHCVVYKHTGSPVHWVPERDVWWNDVVLAESDQHDAVPVPAEHPLFVLYTSGSTGKPKGLLHTAGGYLLWAAWTCQVTFDLRQDDVFACVADVGWITGHSYIVYGPLANGATTFMFESVPTHPDAGRYWDMVQRHEITVFYGAPTALRTLAAAGDDHVRRYDRSSLRVLGTVGEPINPETWKWYHDVVGDGRCAVVDTWWQTETGGHLITPIAPVTPTKPGSATLPLPGVQPVVFDDSGHVLFGPGAGKLCIAVPWPGQARTVWGDHERYVATYFQTYPNYYFTGDGVRRDADGYYWITGRVDDVVNVAGHRMGTAEFESALVSADMVAEAAVVGYPHDVKGQGVWAFVVLRPGETVSDKLPDLLNHTCREAIGAHARVDRFQFVPGLPKTRSGKVMRRILRKIAEGEPENLGDLATLADPSVVQAIIDGAAALHRK